MPRPSLGTAAKLLTGVALLAVLVWQVDIAKVGALLRRTDPLLFIGATCAAGIGLAAQALRWSIVARELTPVLSLRDALIGVYEGQFVNQIMPAMIGGDAVRALRAYDAGATAGRAILGVLLDRAFGLLFIALIVIATFALSAAPVVAAPVFQFITIAAGLVVAGALALAIVGPLVATLSLPHWLAALASVIAGFATIARRPIAMLQLAAAMLVAAAGLAAGIALSARAIGVTLSPVDAIVVLTGIVIAGAIPLSVGGWGLREGATVLLLKAAGVEAAAAVSLAILFGLALTVLGIAGGAVWLTSGYRRVDRATGLGELKRAATGAPP